MDAGSLQAYRLAVRAQNELFEALGSVPEGYAEAQERQFQAATGLAGALVKSTKSDAV